MDPSREEFLEELRRTQQTMEHHLSGLGPAMAMTTKGIDIIWRNALLDAAGNQPTTVINVSRSFDPRKLPRPQLSANYLLFAQHPINAVRKQSTYRLTFDGHVCDSLFGPLRALLRAAMPRNKMMKLTTSSCRGFEELAAISAEKATPAYIQSTIQRLRDADGGVLAVVHGRTIVSMQYVKPSRLLQILPREGLHTLLLQQVAGTAYVYNADDQVISRLDNRILHRMQAGMTDVIHVRPELTASDLIQAMRKGAGKLELGTKKLILSYKHNFHEQTGRTFLVDDTTRCEEITACLKQFYNNQKVQLWVDEILTRLNRTWFSSWVEVGLSPYTAAEVLILNDERYDLNSMWLNIELNMAIMCRGAVVTRESELWTLVSKLTAQTPWFRSGTHIQGAGLSPEKAVRTMLCRWISGIIPQNARDPADVQMLDQLAYAFLNSTDSNSLAHYDSTDMEKAFLLCGSDFLEMYALLHPARNEYSCCQFFNQQTIFDAMYPRMPRVSEKLIQTTAAALPVDLSHCYDVGGSYLYYAQVGNATNLKLIVLQMMKSETTTGEVVVRTTVRHNDALVRYEIRKALDTAYDVHLSNDETAFYTALNILLGNLSESNEASVVVQEPLIDQKWTRACQDEVILNALSDSHEGFMFTPIGGILGEIRGFEAYLPEELSDTTSYFHLPYNASSNVSNRSQMRVNAEEVVRSTIRHAGSIAKTLKSKVTNDLRKELIDLEREKTFLVQQNGRIRVAWKRNEDLRLLVGNLPILQSVPVEKEECTLLSSISLVAYHGSVQDITSLFCGGKSDKGGSEDIAGAAGSSEFRRLRSLSQEATQHNLRTVWNLNIANVTFREMLQNLSSTLRGDVEQSRAENHEMLAALSYAETPSKG